MNAKPIYFRFTLLFFNCKEVYLLCISDYIKTPMTIETHPACKHTQTKRKKKKEKTLSHAQRTKHFILNNTSQFTKQPQRGTHIRVQFRLQSSIDQIRGHNIRLFSLLYLQRCSLQPQKSCLATRKLHDSVFPHS